MTFLPASTLNRIEGFIDREEGDRLAFFAATVRPDRAIVEIGTATGSGAAYLAAGAAQGLGARLYCVDPYESDDEERGGRFDAGARALAFARARLDLLGLSATFIVERSLDAAARWDGPAIGMLHLDGLHDRENARADLLAWAPHMAPGAVLIMHDFYAPKRIGEVAAAFADCDGLFDFEAGHRWSRYPKRRGQGIARRKVV